MHAGAAGKVIMAYLPNSRVNRIIDRGLPAFTHNTITVPEHLRTELERIKKEGYAFSNSEFAEGDVTFAAPILYSKSKIVGCVNIVIPVDRFVETKRNAFKILVIESAAKISQLLANFRLISSV